MTDIVAKFLRDATRASIFSDRAPILMDMRSESEFLDNQIPLSVNLPILNDEERHKVGLTFKNEGRGPALALGHSLVNGKVREDREAAWIQTLRSGATNLACWRGGLRSKISQEWLKSRGFDVERLEGGTKAVRKICLAKLDEDMGPDAVLRGRTGSGKTKFLKELSQSQVNFGFLDLEACANHRGSSFGKKIADPQPMQASFENRIAFELMHIRSSKRFLIVEGESKSIGKNIMPRAFFEKMGLADFIFLKTDLEERVSNIYEEYILQPIAKGLAADEMKKAYLDSLYGIEKKLGGSRLKEVLELIEKAFANQDSSLHKDWIEKLLVYYYDPLYDFGHQRIQSKLCYEGSSDQVRDFLTHGIKRNAYA